jgi:hypothetical protein
MRRRKTPWYNDTRVHLFFERGARESYPTLGGPPRGRGGANVTYTVEIEVPEYEPRKVEIVFHNGLEIGAPRIRADGPSDSPHRYRDNTLCVWEPKDPVEQRWVPRDGLLGLLNLIRDHLFREAWWRQTGEWLGPELVHLPGVKEAA